MKTTKVLYSESTFQAIVTMVDDDGEENVQVLKDLEGMKEKLIADAGNGYLAFELEYFDTDSEPEIQETLDEATDWAVVFPC